MYTHDEILAMSEDELNHAIAKIKYGEGKLTDCGDFLFYDTGGGKAMPLPVWTRDIAAAWGLVEDILSVGGEITLSSETRSDNKRWGIVIFEFRNDGIGTGYTISNFAAAPIISLAISRAWLMWKEGRE